MISREEMKEVGPPSSYHAIRAQATKDSNLTVRSPEDGVNIWSHKDVVSYYNDRAMTTNPESRIAVFLPCAGPKPYCISVSHKTYLYALRDWLDHMDIYVLSEPMTIVPYQLSDEYPAANYDYNPKYETEASKEIFVSRLSSWLTKFLPAYERKVMIYRNSGAGTHYREILASSIDACKSPDKKFDEIVCNDYTDPEAARIRSEITKLGLQPTRGTL